MKNKFFISLSAFLLALLVLMSMPLNAQNTTRSSQLYQGKYDLSNPSDVDQLVTEQSNKTPLDTLLKNPIFRDNFQDARNLKGKSVELSTKRILTDDEKTMLAMEQYFWFKRHPTTRDIIDMRNFLFRYLNNDASYMDTTRVSDVEVVNKYFEVMQDIEQKMQTVKHLNPGHKKYEDVDDEDL